jgi:hypothetical protein
MVEVDCPPCIDDVVPHLERWFLRAGSLPLTLDIHYNALSRTSSDALLRLLQRHSARFQDLTLNITPPDDLFRDEMVGALPALKKFGLIGATIQYSGGLQDWDGTITAFKVAPELRDVCFMNLSPSKIDLPWGQLTTFRAESITVAECLLVLSLAPGLVICRFDAFHGASGLAAVPPLLHLKSLILQSEFNYSTDVLKHLTTPTLVHLDAGELELDIWSAFLTRSQCVLDRLAFTDDPAMYRPATYRQYFDALPSLSELKVRQVGQSFYELFRLLEACPLFLPNLKSFTDGVDLYRPWHENGAELAQLVIEMLEARRRGAAENTRLEKFDLHETRGFVGSSRLAERLRVLVDGGMKIHIEGSESWGR